MAVILYGPSQVGANFLVPASIAFPTTFRSTKSSTLNSLLFTSLLYCQASFCWYSASHTITNSCHSSNRSSYFTINSPFLVGTNPVTQAPHWFNSAYMTTSTPYVRENRVSPVELLGVVQYAHETLGSSSAHLPLMPANLFFNPFTIALLVASTWPLLCESAGWNACSWYRDHYRTCERLCYQITTRYQIPRTLVLQISLLYSSIQTS